MREFKDAVSGMNPLDNDDDDDEVEVERKPVRERAGTPE